MAKKRSIKASFALIAVLAMLLSAAAVFLMTYFKLIALVNVSVSDHIKDVMDTFQIEVEFDLETAENMALRLAEENRLKVALVISNTKGIADAVESFYETAAMSTDNITITDSKGNVLYRMHSDKTGDSLASQSCVAMAMKGETMTAIAEGSTIRLGARSGAPIIGGSDDEIIGTVSVTYPFDDNTLVDDVKGDADSEYAIYLHDERVSTTITENGQRLVGTKMSEEIAKVVLEQGQEYECDETIGSNTYKSMYKPLLDENGDIIGALYTGVLTNNIKSGEATALVDSLLVAVLAAAAATICIIIYVNVSIAKPIIALCKDTEEMARGNLQIEIAKCPDNEIGSLAESIRATVFSLRGYIDDISANLNSMASGDMDIRIEKDYIGDFSSIKASLEKISDSLNSTLRSINVAAKEVSSGSVQVAQGAQSLSDGAIMQASSIQELAASIDVISQKINTNAENAKEANAKTNSSGEEMGQINKTMNDLVAAMEEIKEKSAETNKIVKTIDDIAFQTNILALNAAVEAARAGEAGKGFAVVADEVRNLAGKSAEAVKNTTVLIDDTTAAIEKGSRYVEEVAEKIERAAETSRQAAEINAMIFKDSKDAADSITQITAGVDQISGVVQTNSATAEQSAAASEELSGQANMLQTEMAQFKLRE